MKIFYSRFTVLKFFYSDKLITPFNQYYITPAITRTNKWLTVDEIIYVNGHCAPTSLQILQNVQMLLKTEVWYDKILPHKPMSVHSGLSFQYNAVQCTQETNVKNNLHMHRLMMMVCTFTLQIQINFPRPHDVLQLTKPCMEKGTYYPVSISV